MSSIHYRTLWSDTSAPVGWDLRWLVTQRVFNNIIVAVGILTGFILPRLFVLFKLVILLFARIPKIRNSRVYIYLCDRLSKTKTLEQVFVATFMELGEIKPNDGNDSEASDEAALGADNPDENANPTHLKKRGRRMTLSAISLLAISLLSGLLVFFAVAPPWLDAGDLVISNSPKAGIWTLIPRYDGTEVVDYFVFLKAIETRAAEYARQCYQFGPSKYEGSDVQDGCNFFANSSIGYTVTHNNDCMFDNKTSCLLGPRNSTITMDTGHISTEVLGLNSRRKMTFRRRMRCAPVVTEGYSQPDPTENTTQILDYGPGYGANYTLKWGARDTNSFYYKMQLVADVDTKGLLGSRISYDEKWHPYPQFKVTNDSSLAFMIIDTGTIEYLKPVHDPIFKALNPRRADDSNITYYERNYTQPNVLGCSDTGEVCDVKSGICWDTIMARYEQPFIPTSNPLEAVELKSLRYLLYYALAESTAKGAISIRQPEGLDASRDLGSFLSTSLPDDQWKIEAQRIFETSLARAQFTLYDIAMGTWADNKYFENLLSPQNRTRTVSLIKVRTEEGMQNVHLSGLLVYMSILLFLFILSWLPWIDKEASVKLCRVFKTDWKILKAVVVLIWKPFGFVVGGVSRIWKALFVKARSPRPAVSPAGPRGYVNKRFEQV